MMALPAWSVCVIAELENADGRADGLARGLTLEQLSWKPAGHLYSVGQGNYLVDKPSPFRYYSGVATGDMNLSKLAKQFSDESAARAFMEELRWGKNAEGAACPRCGGADPYRLVGKPGSKSPVRPGVWKCRACRRQFTVTVGTVFESSHIPLSKWLLSIHLMASSKKGVSAHQLHRNLGITYEAAWFMAHRLRYAMMEGPLAALLAGTVEVDETYVGAKKKRGTKRGKPGPDSHKTPVVALVERSGKVRAFPMARITADNVREAIRSNVDIPRSTLMTDETAVYDHRP